MRKQVIEIYEDGLFTLEIRARYKFFFNVKEDKGFERSADQVLAIMESQYNVLGNLIKIVKEAQPR